MTPPRVYVDYLNDILDGLRKARQFVRGMTFEQFTADDKTVFAVVRALEIIGESTKHIPQSLRDDYPDVPWQEMARMREKLAHDYFGVNLVVI